MTTTSIPVTAVSRKPLYTFLGLVSVLAAISYAIMFGGEGNLSVGILLVQFSPLLAAFITKLIYQHNLRGLGWKWGKTRYQVISYLLPFGIGLVTFGLVWLLGFGGFYNEAYIAEAQTGIADMFGVTIASPYVVMLVLILVNGTVSMFLAFGAIGEEIGWRGFLVPELYKQYNFTKTSIISGVIWTVYHFPVIILLYAPSLDISPWPLMVTATIAGIGLSTILAWLRIKSGSVWTAVIFHAAMNVHIQGFFEQLTVETSNLTYYISGEFGLMSALVAVVVGYLFWRKRDSLPPAQIQTETQQSTLEIQQQIA
jgi:membrane protease YdiL (CAAX protease family)